MKFRLALLLLGLLFPVLRGAKAATAPVAEGERRPPERVEVEVLRVYAAQDAGGVFRAYAVRWQNQEVIVSDTLAKTNYKVGDRITILAMNHPFPQGRESHRLLSFSIVPPPPVR